LEDACLFGDTGAQAGTEKHNPSAVIAKLQILS